MTELTEKQADLIIARHAPRLARDLRLQVDPREIEAAELWEGVVRALRNAGTTSEEVAWNVAYITVRR